MEIAYGPAFFICALAINEFLSRKRSGLEPAVLMTTSLFHFFRRPNYFGETLIW